MLRILFAAALVPVLGSAAPPVKVLIVDGQNNHAWKETTPVLRKILEDRGRFTVTVATTPPAGADLSSFQPDFASYAVVLSNYNGDPWPAPVKAAFERFIREGGGFVSFHAADNSFPEWPEYNQMVAVGGWGNRSTEKFGPMVRYRDGKVVLDSSPGRCGHHGARLPFLVTVRDPNHPIAKGLPGEWMHSADELYDTLCGPAKELTVLATAHSDTANKGTNEEEPMLMTVRFGKGRIFHTTLGHDVAAMQCVGFQTTLQRGTEWAATGKVTIKRPKDFPGTSQPSVKQ